MGGIIQSTKLLKGVGSISRSASIVFAVVGGKSVMLVRLVLKFEPRVFSEQTQP